MLKQKAGFAYVVTRVTLIGIKQSCAKPKVLLKWLMDVDWRHPGRDLGFKIGLILLKRAPHFFQDYVALLSSIHAFKAVASRLSALRAFQKGEYDRAYALMTSYWADGIKHCPKWNSDTFLKWYISTSVSGRSAEAVALLDRSLARTRHRAWYFRGLAFAYSLGYDPRPRYAVTNRIFGPIPMFMATTLDNLLPKRPESVVHVTVPYAHNSILDRAHVQLPVPERRAVKLSNALVIDGNQVLQDGALIVYEPAADPNLGFVAGLQLVFSKSEVSPSMTVINYPFQTETHLEEATLISGRCTANYFHFLIEYLPKIPILMEARLLNPGSVLLVDAEMPAQHHQAIDMLSSSLNLRVVRRQTGSITRVDSLVVMAPPTFHPDEERFCFLAGSAVDPDALLAFRTMVLKLYEPLRASVRALPKRVYLSRRRVGARGLSNEAEVEAMALECGFTILDPASLSFMEQVHLFQTADTIIGPGGAAFATTLFARSGLRLVAFTAEQNRDYSMIGVLAGLVGANYSYVVGPPDRPRDAFNTQLEWRFSTYSVPLDDLRNALDATTSPRRSGSRDQAPSEPEAFI